ncbi:phospholipid scramblase 3-like isoform X2 [Ceratina calcarata]|nr:phospholipid scramblase 3-like isoform X2 [Ceratina calcarata]
MDSSNSSPMDVIATAPAPGAFSRPEPGNVLPGTSEPGPELSQGGWSPLSTICPPGLEFLIPLDQLRVRRKLGILDPGYVYKVMNNRNEKLLRVWEESKMFARSVYGNYRNCDIYAENVINGTRREVLRMVRDWRWKCNWCLCCSQDLDIYSGDTLLGSVRQNAVYFRGSFSICDASGETVLLVELPYFECGRIKIKSADGVHTLGAIRHAWNGACSGLSLNDYEITFPPDLDVKIKAVLLGACILIEIIYFATRYITMSTSQIAYASSDVSYIPQYLRPVPYAPSTYPRQR